MGWFMDTRARRLGSFCAFAGLMIVGAVGCGRSTDPMAPEEEAAMQDREAPTVTLSIPDGPTDRVIATFSEPMAASTISDVSFFVAGPEVTRLAGVIEVDPTGTKATFRPEAGFTRDTRYIATVTTTATDRAGNGLSRLVALPFTAQGAPVPREPRPPRSG